MDVVTITDHDSIDGCLEFLDRHPDADDFFISEEIECVVPWGPGDRTGSGVPLKVHIGAYTTSTSEFTARSSRCERASTRRRRTCASRACSTRSTISSFSCGGRCRSTRICARSFPCSRPSRFATARCSRRTTRSSRTSSPTGREPDPARSPSAAATRTRWRAWARPTPKCRLGIGTSFLRNLRAGLTSVGGRHGSTVRVMREIYGVVGRYWASLAGIGRQELSWPRRAIGIGFSALSMPAEFTPALVAPIGKAGERRRIGALPAGMG